MIMEQQQQQTVNEPLYGLSPDSTSTINDEYNRLSSSTTGSLNDDGKICLICGHISHGFHFGILASFFRRTIAENKVYKCRQQCNCPIRKDMRNTCRHCRFNKCMALGMNKNDVQMNRDPIGRRRELQTIECCSKESACCDSNGKIPDTDTEMEDLPKAEASHSVSPSSSQHNSTTSTIQPQLFGSMQTNAFTAALANVLPQFSHPVSISSIIDSTNSPINLLQPQNTSIFTVPTTSILPTPISTFQSMANSLGAVFSTSTFVPSINSLTPNIVALNQQQYQQQQNEVTLQLLQAANAAENVARQEKQRLNELKMAQKPEPSIALLPYTPLNGPSLLQRLNEGYANYQSSQKSLYTVMYPGNMFEAETYRLVKHSEHVKMERGCLSLMFSMCNDWYQPFDTLDHTLKIVVLRAFSTSFSHLDQCFKTMSAFPEMDDSRFVLHYGQYIDANKLEFFFQEHKDPNIPASTCKDVIMRCRNLTNKIRKLKVREIEIASLAGLILWNEVALASNFNNTDTIRDRIYSELHNNIILNYGIMETGARMGALLCLLHDLNVISKKISESVIIGKIFNPHSLDLWDEY